MHGGRPIYRINLRRQFFPAEYRAASHGSYRPVFMVGTIAQGVNCKMRVQFPSRFITQTSSAWPSPIHFCKVNSLGKSAADERGNTTALKALATLETLVRLNSGSS